MKEIKQFNRNEKKIEIKNYKNIVSIFKQAHKNEIIIPISFFDNHQKR